MSRAPRLLISGVCLGQPAGGVRRHNAELLPRLARILEAGGGRLAVLEGRVPITFDLPDSVEIFRSRVHWLPAPMRAAGESKALKDAIESAAAAGRPFDLVHTAHQPTPRGLPLPFTLTIHDLRSLDLDRAPFVRRLIGGKVLTRATQEAAAIFVVSEWMQSRVAAEFPWTESKLSVIGNGVDHLPVLARSPDAAAPFLLHLGHIEPRKNLDLVVRALALDAGLPPLVLAGSPKGNTGTELLELAASLGVQDRIRIEEAPDDARVAELYARATCAVFPSRLEGHGIGPLEALRAGCPVAVSRIPAHVETLGETAEFFEVEDPEGCARALRAVLRDLGLRDRGVPAPPRFQTWDDGAEAWAAGLSRALPAG
ncbi:Glycogen synthase [Planctomycetes bacterium Poly30]|uniref:Glycogen synthase n=1 Tax=Saltatorellus ferox TaxID=2528018 RepID=A0A518EXW5_9BACT|nr:Glycogen synthase [Planctomycetes bacterium Poly30]